MQATETIHYRFYVRWWQALTYALGRWELILGGGGCIAAAMVLWLLVGAKGIPSDGPSDEGWLIYFCGALAMLAGVRVALGENAPDFEFAGAIMIPLLGLVYLAMGAAFQGQYPDYLRHMIIGFAVWGMVFALIVAPALEWCDRRLDEAGRWIQQQLEARGIFKTEEQLSIRRAYRKSIKRLIPARYWGMSTVLCGGTLLTLIPLYAVIPKSAPWLVCLFIAALAWIPICIVGLVCVDGVERLGYAEAERLEAQREGQPI